MNCLTKILISARFREEQIVNDARVKNGKYCTLEFISCIACSQLSGKQVLSYGKGITENTFFVLTNKTTDEELEIQLLLCDSGR